MASKFRKTAESFTQGAKTLARRYFTDAEVFAAEQERIFARQWVCVGHCNQIPRVGDFFTANVAGESVIVLLDRDAKLRAFYNVCRHRGTRLCAERQGQLRKTIQCPYHAWSYGLDGRLVSAPDMDRAAGFDAADFSLHSVALAEWEGLIFVSLAAKPEPFDRAFAPLRGKFSHWNLPKLRSARRIEYDVRANWKLIFQNYNECYHCPSVHPRLAKLTPATSAENDLFEGPFLGGFMLIPRAGSMTMSAKTCARLVGDFAAEDHHRVYYYSIFPNLLLSLHPDYVMTHLLTPESPTRVRISCDWHFHPEAFGRADFRPDDAVEFWDLTNRQDWHICEQAQQGISSRKYKSGPYSPRESIPAAFDREYLRVMGKSSESKL